MQIQAAWVLYYIKSNPCGLTNHTVTHWYEVVAKLLVTFGLQSLACICKPDVRLSFSV